jgi:hypothetical protein
MQHRKCSDTVHLPAEGAGDIYVQVAVKSRALIPIRDSPFPRDLLTGAVNYRAFVNISFRSIFTNPIENLLQTCLPLRVQEINQYGEFYCCNKSKRCWRFDFMYLMTVHHSC